MVSLSRRLVFFLGLLIVCGLTAPAALADGANGRIGIVVMHGKGASPAKHVADLAASLEAQGFLVANLEMPWSGRRDYDATVEAAEAEVETALKALRERGAQALFVCGHSQGGLFALYFGTRHGVDGVIAIAPGGSVASPVFRENLGESVETARRLVAEGKGGEKTRLMDFESSRGSYPVVATPAVYLTWFDPAGAMNEPRAVQNMNPAVPVLFIVPTRDYPGLLRVKQQMFESLPQNPRTRLYEPEATHKGAPSASVKEIAAWVAAVANEEGKRK